MFKKILYCFIWSLGLFFVTLYGFFNNHFCFPFDGETFRNVFGTYIMPMVMAMALYLLDVIYIVFLKQNKLDGKVIVWVLSMLFVFMITFVFSMFVNNGILGWIFMIMSWTSLSLMKFQTTEKEINTVIKISEE